MTLIHGDCLKELAKLKSNTVDALVTDPPAGISFMGKAWDDDKGGRDQWIDWMVRVMSQVKRVLKPGACGFVWALPRTSHWTATALEEAGFEIIDICTHLFGSGFPKSLDVSKAIDKAAGAEREVLSTRKLTGKARVLKGGNFDGGYEGKELECDYAVTAPATEAAKKWQGWGTALKPASEHWILVRKPCSEKTVAANVLRWGTGALNIDASRVDLKDGETTHGSGRSQSNSPVTSFGDMREKRVGVPNIKNTQGRFPANLLLSCSCEEGQHDAFCPVHMLDEQTKDTRAGKPAMGGTCPAKRSCVPGLDQSGRIERKQTERYETEEVSGASRFFYCAKASKSEKNAGLEGLESKRVGDGRIIPADNAFQRGATERLNTHPTVKAKKLMSYLIRMITKPGGLVLDPFMGSGSTGVAALSEGFQFIGIEREEDYYMIAKRRLEKSVRKNGAKQRPEQRVT